MLPRTTTQFVYTTVPRVCYHQDTGESYEQISQFFKELWEELLYGRKTKATPKFPFNFLDQIVPKHCFIPHTPFRFFQMLKKFEVQSHHALRALHVNQNPADFAHTEFEVRSKNTAQTDFSFREG